MILAHGHFGYPSTCGGAPRLRAPSLAVAAALLVLAPTVAAQPEWASTYCRDRACVFVEADKSLDAEADELVKTLKLRMCGRGLAVFAAPFSQTEPKAQADKDCLRPKGPSASAHWWTVYLREMVADRVLAVVDHLGRRSNEDVVRDLPRGPDAEATAWTVVLAVEEAVAPYLEAAPDAAALGAGLALVEPPEVGGPPPRPPEALPRLPRVSGIRVGVTLYYLDAVRSLLAGPHLGVSTELARRVWLSLGAGWAGLGRFDDGPLDGTVSHVPLDLLFSFGVLHERFFHLELEIGVSAGFAVYQTSLGTERRTDILFNPWVVGGFRLGFELFGPLRLDLAPFLSVPILHDVLQNQGRNAYRQDWVLPSVAFDLVLGF